MEQLSCMSVTVVVHRALDYMPLQTATPPPPLSLLLPHLLDASAGLTYQKAVNKTACMEWGLPQLSGRKEVRGQLQIGYTCSLRCPPNELHAITSMHECSPLEFVTHGTLSADKALQLTISKDRRVIGVPLHMGRVFFLFQGRPTVSLHFMEGIQTYCSSLHYQDNSTMTVIINTCGVYCACKQTTTADQQTWT